MANILDDYANWDYMFLGAWDGSKYVVVDSGAPTKWTRYNGTVNDGDVIGCIVGNTIANPDGNDQGTFDIYINWASDSRTGASISMDYTGDKPLGPFYLNAGDTVEISVNIGCCTYNWDFTVTPAIPTPPDTGAWIDISSSSLWTSSDYGLLYFPSDTTVAIWWGDNTEAWLTPNTIPTLSPKMYMFMIAEDAAIDCSFDEPTYCRPTISIDAHNTHLEYLSALQYSGGVYTTFQPGDANAMFDSIFRVLGMPDTTVLDAHITGAAMLAFSTVALVPDLTQLVFRRVNPSGGEPSEPVPATVIGMFVAPAAYLAPFWTDFIGTYEGTGGM